MVSKIEGPVVRHIRMLFAGPETSNGWVECYNCFCIHQLREVLRGSLDLSIGRRD